MSFILNLPPIVPTPPPAPAGPAYTLTNNPLSMNANGTPSTSPTLNTGPTQAPVSLGNGAGLTLNSVGSAGSPFTAPAQSATGNPDLVSLQNSLNQLKTQIGNITAPPLPQSFNSQITPTGTTVDSTQLTPASEQQLMLQQELKQNALRYGTNLDGSPVTSDSQSLQPSANLQQQIASGLFGASQFTPQQQNLQSIGAALANQIYQTKQQQLSDTQYAMDNGQITSGVAQNYIGDINNQANMNLTNLNNQLSVNTAAQTQANLQQQNQIAAFQNVGNLVNGGQSTVAPGSSVYNPYSGGVTYQGTGASPAEIASQAQTFMQNDQSTGQLRYTPDGQIDQNYYQQKAQQYFSPGGAGYNQTQTGGGTGTTPQNTPQGIAGIPPQFQSYVISPGGGLPPYIDSTLITDPSVLKTVGQDASNAGLKVYGAADVNGIKSTQQAIADVAGLANLVNGSLSSGFTGSAQNIGKNLLNSTGLQFFPGLAGFNQARTSAINDIKAIAGGQGSGLRLNSSEIGISTSNLPLATDNLETAQTKLAWVNAFLNTALQLKMTGQTTDALVNAANVAANKGNYSLSSGLFGSAPNSVSSPTSSSANPFDPANYNIQ